jgi:hypothetical protein
MNLKVIMMLALLGTAAYAQLKNTTYPPGSLPHVPGSPVVVNRFGVSPSTIVRQEGPFVLVIMNRLPGHTEHLSIGLDQPNSPELVGLDTSAAKTLASAFLDLQPNTYRVSFRNNPNLSLTVVIKPQGETGQ